MTYAQSGAAHRMTGCSGSRFDHVPTPFKALLIVGAFLIFPPLGLVVLGYAIWRAGAAFGPKHRSGPLRRTTSGNSAFDAHREEVLTKLAEDAAAFAAYEKAQQEAQDKAAYDSFLAQQNATK
jgi:hypothetical protein